MKLYVTFWNIRILHLLISVVVTILPIIFIIILLYFHTVSKLQNKAITSSKQSIKTINNLLTEIDHSATKLLNISNPACEIIEPALIKYTVTHTYIRTLNLTKDSIIYCSSFADANYRSTFLAKGELMHLFSNNDITPDRSFVYYHKTKGAWGVLIAIDGSYLAYLLNNEKNSFLVINENWLDIKGLAQSSRSFKGNPDQIEVSSNQYPFKIITVLSLTTYLEYMLEHYLLFLLILSLVMIPIGIKVYIQLPIHDIVKAMRHKQFIPYYQLIKISNSDQWSGVEVLIRWQHPKKGLIMPNEFISAIERSKHIIPFTLNLMEHVKNDFIKNLEIIPKGFHISINISPKHLQTTKLALDCEKFLQHFPKEHIQLTLEITEREIAQPTETAKKLFNLLQDLKVFISIDDFGTGHSSLSYLTSFKVDYIKIDQSFVSTLEDSLSSRYIINGIIDLANNLNIYIIAEGVENHSQKEYLTQHGVKYLQGYLFSKPTPIAELQKILAP
ncbi:cyclic diguanylate phosphodiesterase [Entomomonas sp. E2T0]|uniref:EAL domain-containing protein n=1 Tax=Entomomonas sp. E2T0 TaxID=2930213 RepID=UPI0022282E4D|nr:EAL domain-containing protein [Entomomonas sp. E2T0]UYZ83763.1 cyclic diguanylate phosphodiesterase [Entomomonas sp. E2T0]